MPALPIHRLYGSKENYLREGTQRYFNCEKSFQLLYEKSFQLLYELEE